jgi:hypothetical protein
MSGSDGSAASMIFIKRFSIDLLSRQVGTCGVARVGRQSQQLTVGDAIHGINSLASNYRNKLWWPFKIAPFEGLHLLPSAMRCPAATDS